MMWIVELSGDQHGLQKLDQSFPGQVPLVLADGRYRLDPALFAKLDDHAAVRAIAQQEVDYLNGYVRLFLTGCQPLAFGPVSLEQAGQAENALCFDQGRIEALR